MAAVKEVAMVAAAGAAMVAVKETLMVIEDPTTETTDEAVATVATEKLEEVDMEIETATEVAMIGATMTSPDHLGIDRHCA